MLERSLNDGAILKRFQRCFEQGSAIAARYQRLALVNENFVQGNQWGVATTVGGKVSAVGDAWFDGEGVPRIYVNECQGLMTTWSALLNKDRRTAVAVPSQDDIDKIFDAEISNRLIEFFCLEQETASKIHQMVQNAFKAGTAGLKIIFDRNKNEVTWEPLTVHGYLIDPVPDATRAGWVIFENHYTEDEVADLWEQNHITTSPPKEQGYVTASGEQHYGILGHEFWQRPTREFPGGFYACVINNKVVERMEYPFVRETDGEPEYLLPLVLMKCRSIWDSAYGMTPLTDVIPLQRSLNEMVSRILKLIRQGSNAYLVLPQELEDLDLKTASALYFPKNATQAAKAIGYTQPATIQTALFEFRDYFRAMINEVAGLNDVVVGNENRALSGKALENLVELDKQKNADASKSLDDAVIAAFRLTLALMQMFYPTVRKAKIGGVSAADIAAFNDADIQGLDLQLEQGSEIDQLDSVKKAATSEQVQTGTASASALDKASHSIGYGMSRKLAEEIVRAHLAGEEFEIEPDDLNVEVFRDVITRHKAAALRDGRREDWKALFRLDAWVRDELAAAQGQAQPVEPQQQQQQTTPPPAPTEMTQ